MDEYESLSHTKWDCKYHIIFIPKCRRRTIYSRMLARLKTHFSIITQLGRSTQPDRLRSSDRSAPQV
jgi:hypothetical protein